MSAETPLDLAEVQADDALLDQLSRIENFGAWEEEADAALITSLAQGWGEEAALDRLRKIVSLWPVVAWLRDVDSEPVGELVDTDTALTVIHAARRPRPLARMRAAVRALFHPGGE